MSKLLGALSSMPTPGMDRLRGVAQAQSQVVQAGVDPSYGAKSQLLGSVGKLAEYGANMFMQADARNKAKADERSNEILSKLTPEQLKEARQNGTLLYQDDKYAMTALKEKTGRNAAFQMDDEVAQKIQRGELRTRQELDEFRHKRLQDGRMEAANAFGFNADDPDFQRGFNSNITERNIHIYGAHDTFLSDQAKKGALLNTKVELTGALSDPDVLRSPKGPEFFKNYLVQGLTNGTIPSDDDAKQTIQSGLADIVQREGGSAFLQGVADQKIVLHGREASIRDVLGEENFNNLVVKSQHAEFMNNSQRYEKFQLDINSAANQADPNQGWAMLDAQEAALNKAQPGNLMTPERQAIVQARTNLQDRLRQSTAATVKAMDDQRKGYNKNSVLAEAYQKRINGQYVSTDFKDMPTNENTGEFKQSDANNFAAKTLSDIDAMDITDAQKDQKKLQYLQADSANGPFRAQVQTMVNDAAGEWQAAVINGEMPESTPAMDNMRRMRNTNPGLFASLYPDQAGLFTKMDLMDTMGVKPQILIDAERNKARLSRDQQIEADKAWTTTLNQSKASELSRMPAELQASARAVYDAHLYATGNTDGAMAQVTKFLQETTTTFKGSDSGHKIDGGDAIGVIPNVVLQVNDDPASYKQGQDMINQIVQKHIATNPWVTDKHLSVTSVGNRIRIMDTTGDLNITYDNDMLRRMWADNQQRVQAQKTDEALKDANKRGWWPF